MHFSCDILTKFVFYSRYFNEICFLFRDPFMKFAFYLRFFDEICDYFLTEIAIFEDFCVLFAICWRNLSYIRNPLMKFAFSRYFNEICVIFVILWRNTSFSAIFRDEIATFFCWFFFSKFAIIFLCNVLYLNFQTDDWFFMIFGTKCVEFF